MMQGMTLKPEADPAAERGPSSSCSRQPRAEGNDFLSALPGRLRKKAEEAEKRSKTPSEAAVPSRQPEKEVGPHSSSVLAYSAPRSSSIHF